MLSGIIRRILTNPERVLLILYDLTVHVDPGILFWLIKVICANTIYILNPTLSSVLTLNAWI